MEASGEAKNSRVWRYRHPTWQLSSGSKSGLAYCVRSGSRPARLRADESQNIRRDLTAELFELALGGENHSVLLVRLRLCDRLPASGPASGCTVPQNQVAGKLGCYVLGVLIKYVQRPAKDAGAF